MAGIYIHIPFCRQACHYCNFHFTTSLRQKGTLVAALVNEINITPLFDDNSNKIDTVYFGGGSPSILPIDDLQKIFDALHKKFIISEKAEITLEANPDDIDTGILTQWLRTGINRLSMGIQSFDEDELQWMNRAHNATDSLRCIDDIKAAGFNNFSVDLIYGSPLLTNDKWKRNVDIILEKEVPHISCYALTVEPKTPLHKMVAQHKKENVDADKQANQFLSLMQWMRSAGYEHYEISNYALPGMRSRHNSNYWQGEKYFGFGPSAHSYNGSCRRWNISNNNIYIQSLQQNVVPFEEEKLTPTQQLNEYIMTSLRTMEGLNIDWVTKTFGEAFSQKILSACSKYMDTGKLILKNDHLRLTDEGKLFADGIAADLFFD